MNHKQIVKFCAEEPEAADTLIKSIRRVNEFNQTRGAMLRSLRFDPAAAAFIKQLKEFFKS